MSKPPQLIYLDHAAATPLDPRVLKSMQPYLTEQFYNPSSLYQSARSVRADIEDARWRVAQVLGAKKTEVIFTAGGTESVNLAILGIMSAFTVIPYRKSLFKRDAPDRGPSQLRFVTTTIEHEAVLACIPTVEKQGHLTTVVPVQSNGIVDASELATAIDDQTVLVSVMQANNEIGTIQPIRDITKLVQSIREDRLKRSIDLPLYFHTDACQAPGSLDLHVSRLGVDLMTLNGSKMYGPKQTGCLYVRSGTVLEPVIVGGGQERGMRSGTENVAGIIGFATALERAQQDRDSEVEWLTELRDYACRELQSAIPGVILNGHPTKRLAGNLNLNIPGVNGETAVLYLDREGIMASTGSACSTANTDPSHVLLAIGRTREEASSSLRFSLGRATTRADVDRLVTTLAPIIKRLRQLALNS